jgi:ornithine cyclodeaminase/alanine dehydrogenase-like protein (mu-crystallin family)
MPSLPVLDRDAVLSGQARGRDSATQTTLFDSTGLAIQDLAVSAAAYRAWRASDTSTQTVSL